eukprot:scaffold398135_cov55-Attheya_sp.AAC.4
MNHSERSTSCGIGENAATTRQQQEFLELLRAPSVLGSVIEQRVHACNDDDKVENKSSCRDAPLVTPLQASALSNILWALLVYSRRTACLGRKGPNDDSEKVKRGESSEDYQQRDSSERPHRIRIWTCAPCRMLNVGKMHNIGKQHGVIKMGALEANRSCYEKSISLLRNAIRIDPNSSNANSYPEAVLKKKQHQNQKQRDQGSNINGALMKLRADQAMQDAIAERAF